MDKKSNQQKAYYPQAVKIALEIFVKSIEKKRSKINNRQRKSGLFQIRKTFFGNYYTRCLVQTETHN